MSELDRRPGPVTRVRVEEITPTGRRDHEDRVVTEEPLEVRLSWPGHAAERVWVTMRTPGHDFELATGWALHEGHLLPDDLATVAYCTDVSLRREQEFNVVTVALRRPPRRRIQERVGGTSAGSACGVCGTDAIDDVASRRLLPAWQGPWLTDEMVRGLPDRLRQAQRQFQHTGGSHAAALVDSAGELTRVREDVGRHNALDKATGAAVLAGVPTPGPAAITSGRGGFELVQKTAAAGIGALVALGAPTSLAVRTAADSGVRLYGFTRTERVVRYA